MHIMAKKRTTITIEEDLLEFARYLGLNVSAFLEERLKELKNKICGCRDLNPGLSRGRALCYQTTPHPLTNNIV